MAEKYIARAVWQATDADGDISLTADQVIDGEADAIDTGLLDINGTRLYRVRERVKIGFANG